MWDLKTMPDFNLSFSCTPTDTVAKCSGTESNGRNSSCCIRIEQERQPPRCPRYESRTYHSWHGNLWFAWGDVGQRAGRRDLQPSIDSSSSLSAYCILTFICSSSGLLMKETALALCSRAVLEQSVRAQSNMLMRLGASGQPRHPQLTSKVTG